MIKFPDYPAFAVYKVVYAQIPKLGYWHCPNHTAVTKLPE